MKKLFIAVSIFLLASCEEGAVTSLSENEVIEGLKEALITGAINSSTVLSVLDGYYGDAAVKILLPEEVRGTVESISKLPGGNVINGLVEDVVLMINRAAEDAAKEVAPVFIGSIKQMTVKDGFNILKGADNAATEYLKSTTFDGLYALYEPKIAASMGKKLIGNVSATDSWNALTDKWNPIANSFAGQLINLKPIDTDLNNYLTTKALDGMFLKVAGEELEIRKNVNARVSPLLQKVFGSLDGTN